MQRQYIEATNESNRIFLYCAFLDFRYCLGGRLPLEGRAEKGGGQSGKGMGRGQERGETETREGGGAGEGRGGGKWEGRAGGPGPGLVT